MLQNECRKSKYFLFLFGAFYSFSVFAMGAKKPPAPQTPIPRGPILAHGEVNLRVLSYNIHGLSLPNNDGTRLGDIGKELRRLRLQGQGPHLVAIQEGFHIDVTDLIREAGYPYRRSGPGPESTRIGSGLIILSEFPITNGASLVFDPDNSAGFDWNARKGVQKVSIQLPGLSVPVEFLNTHLQADYDDITAPLHETIAARRRQYLEMKDFYWKNTTSQSAVIFPGDFNATASMADYFDIPAYTSLINAADVCAVSSRCVPQGVDPGRDSRISVDHIFYRSGAAVRVEPLTYKKTFKTPINGRLLSDHEGLEVEFKVSW